MTEKRFEVMDWLIAEKPWNLFMFVEIGVDRMHHAFWKFMDPAHHLHEPGNRFQNAIIDYYKFLDAQASGGLLAKAGRRHGRPRRLRPRRQAHEGGLLHQRVAHRAGRPRRQGAPDEADEPRRPPHRLAEDEGLGLGRLLRPRLPQRRGPRAAGHHPARGLREGAGRPGRPSAWPSAGPNGEAWATKVIKPQEYYEVLEGEYPDLMVYFDDLYWRSAGTLGYGTKYLAENDTGPDDAVHAQEGMYILADPRRRSPGRSATSTSWTSPRPSSTSWASPSRPT